LLRDRYEGTYEGDWRDDRSEGFEKATWKKEIGIKEEWLMERPRVEAPFIVPPAVGQSAVISRRK
jgi:hypothetical protein